jgi:hypothetical protein
MDYSCKIELTHSGLDPKKLTYVGAKLKIEMDKNAISEVPGNHRKTLQRYILLYDDSRKVMKRWRQIETILLNRILSGIPESAQLIVDSLTPYSPLLDPTLGRRITPKTLRFKGNPSIV